MENVPSFNTTMLDRSMISTSLISSVSRSVMTAMSAVKSLVPVITAFLYIVTRSSPTSMLFSVPSIVTLPGCYQKIIRKSKILCEFDEEKKERKLDMMLPIPKPLCPKAERSRALCGNNQRCITHYISLGVNKLAISFGIPFRIGWSGTVAPPTRPSMTPYCLPK